MTIKRIRPQEPIKFIIANKKICHAYDTEIDTKLEDKLTNLPESLQLYILSSLDAKYVVQTSVLSKSWFSLWKSVPILTLDSSSFHKLPNFDKFVEKLVCQPLNVDMLIFERNGSSSKKILEKVLSFACSSNVKHLDVRIKRASWAVWPDFFHGYPNSLKSLKLQSKVDALCSYLGPQARFFKNLTELYLENATIHDLDPFLGFDFPMLETCDGLPNLDLVVIGSAGFSVHNEKRKFDNPMRFFMKVYNVKSLKVCPAIVYMLGAFPAELVNRCTPFQDLKSLTLDSGHCHFHSVHGRGHRGHEYWTYERREDARSNVKDYLLRKSPL
ncbi:F-box/LRR-repeat protein-like protein [Tanacetum coccineum]